MSENAERERAIKAVGEEGYAARIDEDDYGCDGCGADIYHGEPHYGDCRPESEE